VDRIHPAFETQCTGAGRLRSSFLGRPVALLLNVVSAVVLALAGRPVSVVGQSDDIGPRERVEEWNAQYEESRARYRNEIDRFESIERDWNRLNDEFLQQRERNPSSAERVLGQIQQLSADRTRAQNAVRTAQRHWQNTGDAFVGFLDAYLELLTKQMQGTPLGDSARDVAILYGNWNDRPEQIEKDLAPNHSLQLTPLPQRAAGDVRHGLARADHRPSLPAGGAGRRQAHHPRRRRTGGRRRPDAGRR